MIYIMLKYICGYFLFIIYLNISICIASPVNDNALGQNIHHERGKLKINKHGEILERNRKSKRPIFPRHLRYTLELPDGEKINLNATKIKNVQLDLNMLSSSGEKTFLNFRGKAFYKDENMLSGGIFMLGAEETSDGTLQSKFSGTFMNKRKKCITLEENLSCLNQATETDTTPNYIGDTLEIPDSQTNNGNSKQRTKTRGHTRSRRNVETAEDYDTTNIIQLIIMVDGAWMSLFRERNNNDEIKARTEAGTYLIGLIVELNLWYRSIGEMSRRDPTISEFELAVYLKTVLYPEVGQEWPFVSDNIVGNEGWEVYDSSRCWSSTCDGITGLKKWVRDNLTEHFNHLGFISSRLFYSDYDASQPDSSGLLGMAYIDTVCNNDQSAKISVNRDGAIDVVTNLGHELGHALGARHDGDSGCAEDRYLMSTVIAQINNVTRYTYRNFSACSVRSIDAHLRAYDNCLQTYSPEIEDLFTDMLCDGPRGPSFDVDFQCSRLPIESTQACNTSVLIRESDGAKMVSELACWDDSIVQCALSNGTCIKYAIDLVTDGTPCGSSVKDEKFCYRGNCVDEKKICTTTTTSTSTTSTTTTSTTSTTSTPTTSTTITSTSRPTTSTTTTSTTTSPTTSSTTTSTTTSPTTSTEGNNCSCVHVKYRYYCCRFYRNENEECCDGCVQTFSWNTGVICFPGS